MDSFPARDSLDLPDKTLSIMLMGKPFGRGSTDIVRRTLLIRSISPRVRSFEYTPTESERSDVANRKPQTRRPIDDPAEYQRFLDMAREVEADETPGALDRAFEKVIKPPSRPKQRREEDV